MTLTDDPLIMSEMFASCFESVYSSFCPQMTVAPHQMSHTHMDPIQILWCRCKGHTSEEIIIYLPAHPRCSRGPPGPRSQLCGGLDELHPALLNRCSESMAYPLFKIFCISLHECNERYTLMKAFIHNISETQGTNHNCSCNMQAHAAPCDISHMQRHKDTTFTVPQC